MQIRLTYMLDAFPSNDGLFNHKCVAKISPRAGEVGCPKSHGKGSYMSFTKGQTFELQLVDVFYGMVILLNQPNLHMAC